MGAYTSREKVHCAVAGDPLWDVVAALLRTRLHALTSALDYLNERHAGDHTWTPKRHALERNIANIRELLKP